MSETALYDAIFVRKSVRRYQPEPLDEQQLQSVFAKFDKLRNLTTQAPVTLRLLGSEEISPRFAIKAPHYIAAWASDDQPSALNTGFLLQQLDLHLVSNGLGSCYCGMAKPVKELQELNGLRCRLLLAFGRPDEPARRQSTEEFDRKSLESIATSDAPRDILEAVRLAPSAVNAQGWYFTGDSAQVHVWRNEKTSLKAMLAKHLAYMDIGIALAHLMVAAQHAGKTCRFEFGPAPEAAPKSCSYICTARLGEQ